MKGLILLFKFMTRLPIPANPEFDSKELGKSMRFFPVVGIVIGLILYLTYLLEQNLYYLHIFLQQ